MKAVVQRVSESSVTVDSEVAGKIGAGLMVLLGVAVEDTEKEADWLAEKIINSILTKCNIQSIILSNTVNLPPPVPMPKVNTKELPAVKAQEKKEDVKMEKKKETKPLEKQEKQESLKK